MVIMWKGYRFSVLTESMIRIEYSPSGVFNDNATKTVVNRSFPKFNFEKTETGKYISIITNKIKLTFQKKEGGFTASNLKAEVIGNFSTYHSTWYYGQEFETLKGTARTLDLIDGEVPLEEGLMNKNGYAVINDSTTTRITPDGWVSAPEKDYDDFYFLGYGRDYLGTLRDYFQLTGHPPLVPRYALGNWWSRFYPYSEESYKELMYRFQEKDIPFSVGVIDMDWHITDVPAEYGSGWTGYTWNTDLFPHPQEFLNWLHEQDMYVSLNLHPAHGIQPHEEAYAEMAVELGFDPNELKGISFNFNDKNFVEAYFKYLHHPLEEMGVDFWWIDWQQGENSNIEGVDPLWMLNHFHYHDLGRNGKRSLIFSRYAGLGSHRYPIGFSGDTITTWDSLNFQPYFTATASNVGYTWWSHDIGGHMRGVKDKELYVRWIQYGVFSPINRLHSTGGKYNGKEPWRFGQEAESIVKNQLQLRHHLVPYLYSMNVLTHKEGLPLIQPMYYQHPWNEEAYTLKNQYYFGSELIVAPITTRLNEMLQLSHVKVWLPQGYWFDFFTGFKYKGGRYLDIYRSLENTPVFAKAGAIVPMDKKHLNNTENPINLDLSIFAGATNTFNLYEDSGTSEKFDGTVTQISQKWHPDSSTDAIITVSKPIGNLNCLDPQRKLSIKMIGYQIDSPVQVLVDNKRYDVECKDIKEGLLIELPMFATNTEYKIILENVLLKENMIEAAVEVLLDRAHIGFDDKEEIHALIFEGTNRQTVVGQLLAMNLDTELVKALSELLLSDPIYIE